MRTFITKPAIVFRELFDGRLEPFGIREIIVPQAAPEFRLLSDGETELGVYANSDGNVEEMLSTVDVSYGCPIVWQVERLFEVTIFSNSDPGFYGLSTEEDFRAAIDRMEAEHTVVLALERIATSEGRPPQEADGNFNRRLSKHLFAKYPEIMPQDKWSALIAHYYLDLR